MILRIIGFLLIGINSCGLGVWYVYNLKQRLYYLQEMNRIFGLFMSQIRYHKSTLTECCYFLASQTIPPFNKGFKQVALSTDRSCLHCRVAPEESGSGLHCNGDSEKCFQNISYKSHNDGRNFAEVYEEIMGRNLAGLPLKPEEMNLFLVGMNGSSEREAQLQLLERKRKEVEELIDKVKEEIREKGKVAVRLGTLGGLLLIVILL